MPARTNTLDIRRQKKKSQQVSKHFCVITDGKRSWNFRSEEKDLAFTKTEYSIFHYLLLRLNRSVSHKELHEAVWKKEYMHDDMNIMAHVHRMRKKMGDDRKNPQYIQNVYGIGYMIEGVQ